MSHVTGDTFYPHHPDLSPVGDVFANTRYAVGGDTWFDVIDDKDQDIAWSIVTGMIQDTAWNVFAVQYEFIQHFLSLAIKTNFGTDVITTNFAVCPVKSNFEVETVTENVVRSKSLAVETVIYSKPIQANFTLKEVLVTDFKVLIDSGFRLV
jgi:hypothetical protein